MLPAGPQAVTTRPGTDEDMIVYTLRCRAGHSFEGWFRSPEDCTRQQRAGLLTCPECGSHDIEKRPSAPHVARGRGGKPDAPPVKAPAAQGGMHAAGIEERLHRFFRDLRREVEKRCEYVGRRFPEEARRIHYGEAERRGIYGEATAEESRALREEGIEIIPIPGLRKTDA
ncbi:MAG: hypothetical protein KatS3mg119_0124 [Rhodothalassiaceae bacterium]|nr:MAG: hypothetical protein KatS3mg119_0124 [Rhodothalassiaceae bacterium]